MPPFQEIVNHARKENITLLHQNNQIQNIMTTTCGYFCLYFLYEMNVGNSYYDVLKVFNIHDTMYSEKFIKQHFKNFWVSILMSILLGSITYVLYQSKLQNPLVLYLDLDCTFLQEPN